MVGSPRCVGRFKTSMRFLSTALNSRGNWQGSAAAVSALHSLACLSALYSLADRAEPAAAVRRKARACALHIDWYLWALLLSASSSTMLVSAGFVLLLEAGFFLRCLLRCFCAVFFAAS